MADLEDLIKKIGLVGTLLGAIVLALKYLTDIYRLLRPYLALIIFLGTIVIPNSLIVWYGLYIAAINSSRMGEAGVFFLLAAQLTAATSIYTFFWGKWFYPSLSSWLKRQFKEIKSPSAQTEETQKQDGTDPPETSK